MKNLLKYLDQRDAGKTGTASLIITDVSMFYEADEEYRNTLRSLITKAEIRGMRIVIACASSASVSFRDLTMIRERIALKNDSLQDLSAIFEQAVHHRIAKPGTGLCLNPELCDLCLLETSEEELRTCVEQAAVRLGKDRKYQIPSMPSVISASDYAGHAVPAGIDLFTLPISLFLCFRHMRKNCIPILK